MEQLTTIEELERKLRRIRQQIDDKPELEADLIETKALLLKAREETPERERVGPYSGLTRRELSKTGTCETDWF